MGTPAANQIESVLSVKFPGMRFGRFNCRAISGSSTYSQHSWNNARDLYPPLGISYPSTEYTLWLDHVATFLRSNMESLNIRVLLWQVRNHYNHIHIDFWPQGWETPPCAGGSDRYRYPNGTVKLGPPVLLNEYEEESENLEEIMTAMVKGAYASGHPSLRVQDEAYWLGLAQDNPRSEEFADLWKAVLSDSGDALARSAHERLDKLRSI